MTYDETDGSIYDFREDYKYDDKGNLIQRTVLDQGTDTADIFYYSYDLYGRLINRTINLKQQGYQLIDTMEYDGNKVIRHVQGYLNSQGFTSSEYKYFYSGNFIVRCDYSTQKEVGQFSVKFRVLYSNNGSRYTKMSTHYFPNGTLGDKTEETIIEGTNDVIQAYTRTSYYQNNVEDVFKMEIQYTPDNKFVKKILDNSK